MSIVDDFVREGLDRYHRRMVRDVFEGLQPRPEDPFEVKWHAPIATKAPPFIITKRDLP